LYRLENPEIRQSILYLYATVSNSQEGKGKGAPY
jgi:hypothetical protein